MARIKKTNSKAKLNRSRVQFHREWKSILNKQNQNDQNSADSSNLPSNSNSNFSAFQSNNGSDIQQENLRRWALKYNISKCAVSNLLTILISMGMHGLPRDSRTLFHTPRAIEMISLTNGKLWYVFSYESIK